MATRQFDFVTGIETASQPTGGTPSAADDLVDIEYADDHYVQGGDPVASITALKAVSSANRADGDVILVTGEQQLYRFDSASSATADNLLILQPDVGTGRWFRIVEKKSFPDFDAIVSTTSQYATHATIASALANNRRILVLSSFALTGSISITQTDVDLVFYPGVVISKSSATTGIDIGAAAARVRIYGGKFSGFNGGGDIAININASAGAVMIRDCYFQNNTTDVETNGNAKASVSGSVTE